MASTKTSTITLSMEPLTKLPNEWRRWRNHRSCSTTDCPRKNKEVSQLASKLWMVSKPTTTRVICGQHRGRKQAKQCSEPVPWPVKCKLKASMLLACLEAYGLSPISTQFLNRTCRKRTSWPVNSLRIRCQMDKINFRLWTSDNLTRV